MEKWKSWAIGIGAAWVLLAFIAWNYESTCGMFLSGKCAELYWDGLRHVLLLKWVYPYKELLAGMAALGGGAFVVIAGREQISHLRESKKRERLEQALDSFYIVGGTVWEYCRKLRESKSLPEPFPMPDASIMRDISYISPQLTQHFSRIQNRTSIVYERGKNDAKYSKIYYKSYLGYSFCLFEIFRQIGRNARENLDFHHRIDLTQYEFRCDQFESFVERNELEEKHLGQFTRFFPLDRFKKED